MVTVSKGVLKAKMLEYFRAVESTGEALIVTDNNTPVLKITPYSPTRNVNEVFGHLRGKFKAKKEDVLAPTTEMWEDA